MAMGSSAPEILLSTLGAVSKLGTEEKDELGPSTIVGSAAFNLLCIGAVCVLAIPGEDYSKINQFGVFLFTASASILAYIWLFVVLSISSPGEVTVVEAFLTLGYFPLLLAGAYAADQDLFGLESNARPEDDDDIASSPMAGVTPGTSGLRSRPGGDLGGLLRSPSVFGGRSMSRLTSQAVK